MTHFAPSRFEHPHAIEPVWSTSKTLLLVAVPVAAGHVFAHSLVILELALAHHFSILLVVAATCTATRAPTFIWLILTTFMVRAIVWSTSKTFSFPAVPVAAAQGFALGLGMLLALAHQFSLLVVQMSPCVQQTPDFDGIGRWSALHVGQV